MALFSVIILACGDNGNGDRVATSADSGASAAPARLPASRSDTAGVVLFVGTSLTAGYGIGADLAFPALIQQSIDSAGLPFRVVNAGVSGETSAGGLRRADWYLQQPIDVLVLELGANDALRGLDPADLKQNLTGIIKLTRERYPKADVVLAGMEAPPNLGAAYTDRFRAVFAEVARANRAALIPFLLNGVAADPKLNQTDGIHPTAEGQKIMAATVWQVLAPLLVRRAKLGR